MSFGTKIKRTEHNSMYNPKPRTKAHKKRKYDKSHGVENVRLKMYEPIEVREMPILGSSDEHKKSKLACKALKNLNR